jgi:hypothetical protein
MRIGFLDNQINERGGTLQVYLYAKYARELLGHSTAVLYPATRYMYDEPDWARKKQLWLSFFLPRYREKIKVPYDQGMANRIVHDGMELKQIDLDGDLSQFDAIYHYKHGFIDRFRPKGSKYWVHAVAVASQPHGDRYAAISSWLGRRCNVPFVPLMMECPAISENLRKPLGIPDDAIVFARYGGRNTFDIPWVWDVIAETLAQSKNVFFLFANTDVKLRHERIFDLPTIYDCGEKRKFINTCDAMLHAREGGESFGIACGEFAIAHKPVLTYAKSPEWAHVEMLNSPVLYNDISELKRAMARVVSGDVPPENGGAYRDCTSEKVMKAFDSVFIR